MVCMDYILQQLLVIAEISLSKLKQLAYASGLTWAIYVINVGF